MTQGLLKITHQELNAALEKILLPRLVKLLRAREAGHCMRATDLDRELMVRLCGSIRSQAPEATVVILADDTLRRQAPDFAVSSTQLVELRNPLPNDELRPPLLLFVPNDLRASAEDSFSVATFEEIPIEGVYADLITELMADLPAALQSVIAVFLAELRRDGNRWPYADDKSVARFLLTCQANEFDPEAIGAALHELALIPDFELFTPPERSPLRVARNRECVERITWSTRSERARALDLGLSDPAFCRQLGDFFSRTGVSDPREWTHSIVRDRENWQLAFNRWLFDDGGINPDSIFIGDLLLPDLPIVHEGEADPKLAELIGQRILPISKTGLKKFSVSFRVDPLPSRVEGLSRFVAEVVSRDNGPTGLRRRKAAWTRATDSGTIAFSSIGKIDWEEGWHFVRVYAETADGDKVPLVTGDGEPLGRFVADYDNGVNRPNESDLFYVVTDEDVEIEPPQRAVPRELSRAHALLDAKFKAVVQGRNPDAITVSECAWVERSAKSGGAEVLEIKLGKEGKANVLVSSVLVRMERMFLSCPISINRLCAVVPTDGKIHYSSSPARWPDSETARRFCQARSTLFTEVLQGEAQLIFQGVDFLHLKAPVQNYAGAYLAWIEDSLCRASAADPLRAKSAFEELRYALCIDSVSLVIHDYRGRSREAVLLGPTHPLRAIWHVTWASLAEQWLHHSITADKEFLAPTRDAVLKQLFPVSFPPVIPFGEELGRTALAIDNITPFWSLYAANDEKDPRGLVGDVCAALSLPEPAMGGSLIDSGYLAARVQRYLIQHPYIRTVTINAFNAGRATILADMLVEIQKNPEFADFRYDLRLFVIDQDAPSTGEALNELLSPESGVTCREADAFSTPTESHLHPKLRVAIRSMDEFRRDPEGNAAHLSFLFDVFPAEEMRAISGRTTEEASFVNGLVQPYAVQYLEDEHAVTWLRRPLHGEAQPLAGAEELTDILGSLSRLMSVGSSSVASGLTLSDSRPVIALSLSADERALLHQVHEVSDWVLTIDRNLGIEFFDHRRHPTRPDYLIDHSPDMASAMGHKVAITSRSVAELESLLIPILSEYGLANSSKHAVALLDQLRSLSGRLALKLLSSSTQRAEALGLALSRLFLEHQGVFQNHVVVPLDAHLDLYKALRQNALELGDDVSFRRTDLALFDLNPATRIITCRLVEVKCYAQVGSVAAYEQLKTTIREQILQTERVLSHHFDPQRTPFDRPDRPIKNRDLAALLAFYLERSERYGIVLPDVAKEARYFLQRLDMHPYQLCFTRSAVVFDFQKPGTEKPEMDAGIEYYRIGRDLIEQLLESAIPDTEASLSFTSDVERDVAKEITQELIRRRNLAPSVPTFDTAAFMSPGRKRTVDIEEGEMPTRHYPVSTASAQPSRMDVEEAVHVADMAEIVADTQAAPIPSETPVEIPPPAPENENEPTAQVAALQVAPPFDIMLGTTGASPQYGVLGEVSGRKVALDLNQTHTISLFGVQGGGKSYTLGSIAEMASLSVPAINLLPEPLATVIFHYSPTMDYKPEFTSMIAANSVEEQVKQLRDVYNAEPRALSDVLLLVPFDKLAERRSEYPDIQVLPLQFSASELKASHWKFLMGAVGNQATYIRQLIRIMKTMRDNITLQGIRAGIDASTIPDHLKALARDRLELAGDFIEESAALTKMIRPGRLVIVDLRDEFIEKDQALGLFVVLLQLFADARVDDRNFNKLVVFDEAHKYIDSPDLVAGLIEVVREMRHKGVSIMVASQDPPSVPVSLIELSTQIILHKFNSPAWLKHIQKANAALANLTPERMAQLKAGEAYIWSSKATDESFSKGAVKVRCRPRVTQHGGATRVAVEG